jgi:hypothetical protein
MARPKPMQEPTVHRLPSFVRTCVTAAPGGSAWTVERGTFLTPYAAEEIAQEARRAGPGARLEVTVPASTSDAGVAAVDSLFAWLREKGVSVVIHRGGPES